MIKFHRPAVTMLVHRVGTLNLNPQHLRNNMAVLQNRYDFFLSIFLLTKSSDLQKKNEKANQFVQNVSAYICNCWSYYL